MSTVVAAPKPRIDVSFAPVAVATLFYLLLTCPLRDWLVDDAAISMAYAANWANGFGLVSQPGLEPVEGYSNFLWVAVLALLSVAGAMTPMGIKFVSLVCVVSSLASLNASCKPLMPSAGRWAVLLLVATNSSIVTWTSSGLENPLTLLLACELLRVASQAWRVEAGTWLAIYAGCLVAALGMTRPEGIGLVALPLIVFAKNRQWRLLGSYLVIVGLLYSGFLAFRLATFHEWVPNTFFAKDAHSVNPIGVLMNLGTLLNGPFGSILVFFGLLAVAYRFMKDDHRLIPPLCMMALTAAIFVLMPPDWMPDRRFGTAFVPAACVFAGMVTGNANPWQTPLTVGLVTVSLGSSAYRLSNIYAAPTMPMADVLATSEHFESLAHQRALTHASLLMPDIGAALLHSHLRIYDLAGLTDRTIGRTLHRDKAKFHDYVFERLKPTFIKVHGPWAELANFDSDPRFRRDYVPVTEVTDPWLLQHRGISLKSGEYVRVK